MERLLKRFKNLPKWKKNSAFLIIIFFFRLIYGLCSPLWTGDELQVYLIGLKFYASGNWPFFGADVVYTGSQIPGALQGLLVGLPFFLLPIPEAPFVLLNLLSLASLTFLARYIALRLPQVPAWFLWPWVFTAPWTLNFSTHVINVSYVLAGAVLFFVSFMEATPALSKKMLSFNWAFGGMGFGLFWVFQVHMSWVLLLPFVGGAFFFALRTGFRQFVRSILFFSLGCLISGGLLFPTLLKFGLQGGSGGVFSNIQPNGANFKEFFTILSRYLSLASFETARFLGANLRDRIHFLVEYWWAAPAVLAAALIGVVQPIWLAVSFFKSRPQNDWNPVKRFALFSFLLTYASFLFSVKEPASHTFYVMLPVVMIYSFYCWQPLLEKHFWRKAAVVLLFFGMVFHIAQAYDSFRSRSMYVGRERISMAIESHNYRLVGERRSLDRNE